MKLPRFRTFVAALLAALAPAAFAVADDDGVVRITDRASQTVVRAQSPQPEPDVQPASYGGDVYYGGEVVYDGYCPGSYTPGLLERCPGYGWWQEQSLAFHARNHGQALALKQQIHAGAREHHDWFRCKFGYFCPTGACGKGAPLVGCYSMVYPVNPYHFDGRDGQIYAAQGMNGPVSVPLAPVVHHAYNYGWGVPSSRLTPLTNPVGGPAR